MPILYLSFWRLGFHCSYKASSLIFAGISSTKIKDARKSVNYSLPCLRTQVLHILVVCEDGHDIPGNVEFILTSCRMPQDT